MTCIVGIVDRGRAYIGADSAAASEWEVRATAIPKAFKVTTKDPARPLLIGYTTSFRMGQILEYHLKVPDQDRKDDLGYMVRQFIPAVRECLKEHGFTRIENSVEEGGQFLVGYCGVIYEIAPDFQVNVFEDEFAACGCGAPYALGALEVMQDSMPDIRIVRALEVAAHFSGGVKAPFRVISEAYDL